MSRDPGDLPGSQLIPSVLERLHGLEVRVVSPTSADLDTQVANGYAIAAVAALTRGDLDAAHLHFRPLHNRYFWRIQKFCRSHLRGSPDPESEADELASETFLAFWRQLGHFDPTRGSVPALLYTISRRLVAERNRLNYRRAQVEIPPDPLESENPTEPATSAAELIHQVEGSWREANRARLLHILRTDAANVCDLLQLRYEQGLAWAEVARRLEVSLDAVRQRDQAARATLFVCGWRIIREEEARAGRALPWYRPDTATELARLLASAPEVASLFGEYFGETSLTLVSPRRESHVRRERR